MLEKIFTIKKLFTFYFILLTIALNGQTECYSSNKYSYLNLKSGQKDFIEVKGPIGLCFSKKFVAIKINETITTFPIQEISISKRKGSNGALIYSFLTDGTSLYGTGYYNIEVVYGKIREVVINNTVAGTVYQMEFKTTKYHYLQEKEFNNVDSLGKAIVKIKYKFSGNEIALCKYCDGIVHDWGKYIYCGRCKKDTNGVNMYEIWGK